MNAIGIDVGTTNICAIRINYETGTIEKSVTKNSNAFINGSNQWEKLQYVDKIMNIATEIIDSMINADTVVIGVTGQMHGIVYIDKNGLAISPLFTWQDGRGNQPYNDTTYANHLRSFSGYGNVTDFYNRINGIRPESAVSYCTISDYLVMRICSLTKPIIHESNAAGFGLYDMDSNKFNYDFNPEITSGYTLAGTYKGIPVSVAIGDNQASVFSTLANDNSVLVNIGTGSQVSLISDTPVYGNDIEVRPYFDNKYLIVGSALCGGRAYALLKDFFKGIVSYFKDVEDDEIYEVMNKFVSRYASSSISVDSRFAGTRSDPDKKGVIRYVTTENFTAPELTVAFIEAIATELYCLYLGSKLQRTGLVASGNAVRKNTALIKALEKKFSTFLLLPEHIEEAAFGAALYALIACGKFRNSKEAHSLIKYQHNRDLINPSQVGSKIMALRKEKNMTQAELAQFLNVSNKAVSRWENGQGFPDVTLFPKLAILFDVTVDYLMKE